MRIAIFSENLLMNSGGAEVYALKLAEVLSKKHNIEVFTVSQKNVDVNDVYKKYNVPHFITKQIKRTFSTSKIKELFYRIIFWFKLKKQVNGKYDYYINTSCNRMLGFTKTKSIHLVHFPVQPYSKIFKGRLGVFLDKTYRKSYYQFWSNSEFTKGYLNKYWAVESIVVNPPIDMKTITEDEILKKENIIIVVGRLVPDKKIKELIESFLNIHNYINNYKLVVIGNKDINFANYYEQLCSYTKDNDFIKILSDISYNMLVDNYKKAKIFWHAKGVGVDENNPLLMEHFGMTTVEAMANGCIPIVINKAGQKEIVEQNVSGFLWDTFEQLQQSTINLINNNCLMNQLYKKVIERSQLYLMPSFTEKVNNLII